jgi:hypothetical protein
LNAQFVSITTVQDKKYAISSNPAVASKACHDRYILAKPREARLGQNEFFSVLYCAKIIISKLGTTLARHCTLKRLEIQRLLLYLIPLIGKSSEQENDNENIHTDNTPTPNSYPRAVWNRLDTGRSLSTAH